MRLPPQLKQWVIVGVASGGFSGFMPVAPGTFGTLVGLLAVLVIAPWGTVAHCVVTVGLLGIGVLVSDKACHIFQKQDSGRVVIDEIVGMLITVIGIPVTGFWLVAGFLIFRFFDIAKLPPASFFDTHVKNGWGVMLDDVVAGIYGNVLLHLMLRAQL